MTRCQVHYVNVIPQTGTVRGVVVVAEDMDNGQLTDSNLCHKGHQIIWNA